MLKKLTLVQNPFSGKLIYIILHSSNNNIFFSNMKRKQGDAVLEMTEQIDALQKMKAKIDKDKTIIMAEPPQTKLSELKLLKTNLTRLSLNS